MIFHLIFLFLLLASFNGGRVSALQIAPLFELDLDKAPEQRWNGSVELVLSRHPWQSSFGPLFSYYNSIMYQHLNTSIRAALEKVVASRFPVHYLELQGLAGSFRATGHPDIDLTFLCFNFFWHEFLHVTDWPKGKVFSEECTGVVALPADSSQPVVHGRNMDQIPSAPRNITLHVRALRTIGGVRKTLFEAVCQYWFATGFMTGWKRGVLTLEQNARIVPGMSLPLQLVLTQILTDRTMTPLRTMYRAILEAENTTFQSAVNFLVQANFIAPHYSIMSTHRVGVVLQVGVHAQNHLATIIGDSAPVAALVDGPLHNVSHTYDPSDWFIAQSTADRHIAESRRTNAEKAMKQMEREYGATRHGVWMAIDDVGVLISATYYSLVMDVNSPKILGFIRRQ